MGQVYIYDQIHSTTRGRKNLSCFWERLLVNSGKCLMNLQQINLSPCRLLWNKGGGSRVPHNTDVLNDSSQTSQQLFLIGSLALGYVSRNRWWWKLLKAVDISSENVLKEMLTVWEGGSESSTTNWCIRDKLDPQDVSSHGGVVVWESTSRETSHQGPSRVALSYFKEVILTGRATMQGKVTEQKRRLLLRSAPLNTQTHKKTLKHHKPLDYTLSHLWDTFSVRLHYLFYVNI